MPGRETGLVDIDFVHELFGEMTAGSRSRLCFEFSVAWNCRSSKGALYGRVKLETARSGEPLQFHPIAAHCASLFFEQLERGDDNMNGRIIEDIFIPAKYGAACRVDKGNVLRIHLIEGQQVGDCAFFNADNPKEQFHVGQTWAYNVMMGTGNARAFQHFYSKPPRENIMMTVVEDTVRSHFGNCAGRCSAKLLATRDNLEGARNCQDNLTEALQPFGIAGDDIGDIFNVFMNAEYKTDGGFSIRVPETKSGDYIDLKAEMNIIAAVSACPNESNPVNNFKAKPMGMMVYEPNSQ